MSVTLNLTTILTWIGGIVCGAVTLWGAWWCVYGVIGMGEFLGIWPAIGDSIRGVKKWVSSKIWSQK